MDWFLGRTGLVIVEVTDLVISDDVVILVESLEILVKAFKSLYEEASPWNFKCIWLRPSYKCLQACRKKHYSLLIHETETLMIWKISHVCTVVWFRTMAGHVKKSCDKLDRHTVLWTCPVQVVALSMSVQRSKSSSCSLSLYYPVGMRCEP